MWLVVAILAAAVTTGTLLALNAWSSETTWGVTRLVQASQAHAAAGLATLTTVLLGVARAAGPLRWDATTFATLAIAAGTGIVVASRGGWDATAQLTGGVVAAMLASAAVGLRAAVTRRHGTGHWSPASTGLAAASLGFAGIASVIVTTGSAGMLFATTGLLLAAALGSLAEPVGDPAASNWATLLYSLTAFRGLVIVEGLWVGPAKALLHLSVGMAVAYFAWRSLSVRSRGPLALWSARLAVVVFTEAIAVRAFLDLLNPDDHLGDTLVAVGAFHLEAFAVVLALASHALGTRESRPRWARAPLAGLAVVAAGLHAVAGGFLAMGQAGMPQRYARYLSMFEAGHRVVAVGAGLVVIGAVLVAGTVRRAPQRPGPGTDAFD